MKKLAAIDIGTNSMRLMLCETKGKSIGKREKELIVTRIGKDLFETGRISEKAMSRNIEALKYFKNKADRYGAEAVLAIATSAVRDASNGKEFAEAAKSQAGVDIRIISGEEEAQLGIIGVMSELETTDDSVLVLDIGGGSTELILGNKGKIDYSVSIPAGAVRMTEKFISENPISDEAVSNLQKRLGELFKDVLVRLGQKKIGRIIAIGGTATTTAAIYHCLDIYKPEIVHNTSIDLNFISSTFKRLKEMTVQERYQVKGLQKERADVIPAGLYIMKYVVEGLKMNSLTVSENDNLEGVISKYISGNAGAGA